MQSEQNPNESLKLVMGAIALMAILAGLYFYNKEGGYMSADKSEIEMPIVSDEEMLRIRKQNEEMLKVENVSTSENMSSASSSSATSTNTVSATSSATSTPAKSSSNYKNGSYSIDIPYTSPGGNDGVKVSISLDEDKISAIEVVGTASNKESREFQEKFSKSYKAKVMGRSIDTLKLDIVGGASLTTEAFNKALQAIRTGSKNS